MLSIELLLLDTALPFHPHQMKIYDITIYYFVPILDVNLQLFYEILKSLKKHSPARRSTSKYHVRYRAYLHGIPNPCQICT